MRLTLLGSTIAVGAACLGCGSRTQLEVIGSSSNPGGDAGDAGTGLCGKTPRLVATTPSNLAVAPGAPVDVVSMLTNAGTVFWTASSTTGTQTAGGVYSAPLAGGSAFELGRTTLAPMPLPMFVQPPDVIVSYQIPSTSTQLVSGSLVTGGLAYALGNLQGLDAIASDGSYLYLNVTGSIKRGQSNGLGVLDMVTQTGVISGGLVVDASSVYWLEYQLERDTWSLLLQRADKTPGARPSTVSTLLMGGMTQPSLPVPAELVADDTNIYWLEGGGALPRGITIAPKNGGTALANPFGSSTTNPRTLVLADGALYFIADDGIHRSATPSGTTDLVLATDGTMLAGLAVDANDIYWGTQGPNSSSGSVYCISK
jgi:hypothetical protein